MAGLVFGEFILALELVEVAESVQDLRQVRDAIRARALPDPQDPESARVVVARDQILSAIDREIFRSGSELQRVDRAQRAVTALAKASAVE